MVEIKIADTLSIALEIMDYSNYFINYYVEKEILLNNPPQNKLV